MKLERRGLWDIPRCVCVAPWTGLELGVSVLEADLKRLKTGVLRRGTALSYGLQCTSGTLKKMPM